MRTLVTLILTSLALVACGTEATAAPPSQLGLNLTRTAVIGDSLTEGIGASPGQSYAALVDTAYARDGGDLRPYAVGGATALRWLEEYPSRLNGMALYRPTTVVVELGGNEYLLGRGTDVWAEHLKRLTQRIRFLAPRAQIVFLTIYDVCAYGFDCAGSTSSGICDRPGACVNEPSTPPSWTQYRDTMTLTATQVGARYVDLSDTPPPPSGITPDLVHPNDAGHRFFADRFIEAL